MNQSAALWKGAILGVVEGVTEFLPISSTGHLIVVGDWLGFNDERAKVFEVFIQLGAIMAVVWVYRRLLVTTFVDARRETKSRALMMNLAVASAPAMIVGLAAHGWIKNRLFNPMVVAVALIAGGLIILVVEKWRPPDRIAAIESIPARSALVIGLAQILALIPGVSRSGATIMGGVSMGLARPVATEFSFFLAVPVMVAATLFDLVAGRSAVSADDISLFVVGFVSAYLSALVVIRMLVRFVSKHSFRAFAYYRIIFGALLLAFYY